MAMTPEKMKQYTVALIARAERNLGEAESNHSSGSYSVASSQAYYSMFDAARALLAPRGVERDVGTDSEFIKVFDMHYIRSGDMDYHLRDYFEEARRTRVACAYDSRYTESRENSQGLIDKAREFLEAARNRLEEELKLFEIPDLRKGREGAHDEDI